VVISVKSAKTVVKIGRSPMLRDYIAAKSVLITFDDKPRKPQQPFLLRLATC